MERYEHKRPSSSCLRRDLPYRGSPLRILAYLDGAVVLDPGSGPHAARQCYRGKEASAPFMSIRAQLGLGSGGEEEEPVRERREGMAGARRRILTIQSGP
jgi:hypothetical protein